MWPMNPGGNRGRPALPEDERRTAVLKVRVKPGAAALVEQTAAAKGMSVSDGMREALADWCQRNAVNQIGRNR